MPLNETNQHRSISKQFKIYVALLHTQHKRWLLSHTKIEYSFHSMLVCVCLLFIVIVHFGRCVSDILNGVIYKYFRIIYWTMWKKRIGPHLLLTKCRMKTLCTRIHNCHFRHSAWIIIQCDEKRPKISALKWLKEKIEREIMELHNSFAINDRTNVLWISTLPLWVVAEMRVACT